MTRDSQVNSQVIESQADRAVRFINLLTLSDDHRGERMVLRPWQEDIVRALFTTGPDGLLAIRRALLLLPRKQAKTQLAACLAAHHILGTGKQGQSALVAASDRHQAGILFKKCQEIIEASPYLSRQCKIYTGVKRIETRKTGNTLQVLSSDAKRAHGTNPSLAILDEVWTQPNNDLYDALTSGFAARKEYLTLLISTQGNRRDSLIYEQYEYAKKVRDGLIKDSSFLPIIYEAPPEDDWRDEATWFKAMPALGDFASLDFIRSEFAKAKELPREESKFLQFYMNRVVASESKWINQAKWDACGVEKFDPTELLGRESYWGIDLSSICDITALVGVFPMDDGTVRVLGYFWIPENYARERDKKSATKYDIWRKTPGVNLEFTSGNEIDYPHIEERIPQILKQYKARIIHVDPYNATSTTQRLITQRLPVIKHRQGWQSMSAPIKHAEYLISKGLLRHNANPVLDWMAANTVAYRDRHDNITFDKETSADKIDGIVAMAMGVSGMIASMGRGNVYSAPGAGIMTV